MKQEMMGWQWDQFDHIQIICTSLHADNHTSTSSLNLYRPDSPRDARPSVKALTEGYQSTACQLPIQSI